MTSLWFLGSADPQAIRAYPAPFEYTSWTWDVEFATSSGQSTYARTSVNTFAIIGGVIHWIFSGIASYQTRDADGVETLHLVGQSTANGVADFIYETGVIEVTFGWGIGADNLSQANINMEIWVSD